MKTKVKEQLSTKETKKSSNKTTVFARAHAFSTILEPSKESRSFAQPSQEKNDSKNNVKKLKQSQKQTKNVAINDEYTGSISALPTSKNANFEQDWLGNSANKSVMQNMRLNEAGRVVASIKKSQIDAYDELESYKRLLKKRKKRLIARICTFMLLLIIAPVMIFLGTIIIDRNSRHDFFGLTFYVVISESMEPEIMVNDCVVLNKVTDVDDLQVGDDIGYINDNGVVVVHRIKTIVETQSGSVEYVTTGINNVSADQKRVTFEQVVGERVATLSVLGNAVVFFRSTPGIILFFTLFIGIIVAFYIAFGLSENIKYIENVD